MSTLMALLSTVEFWFGLVVLLFHQSSKFEEIEAARTEDGKPPESGGLARHLASEFVRRPTYRKALLGYLATVGVAYLLLCLVPATVFNGWGALTGDDALREMSSSAPYPLYIAAGYMGLSQTGFPFFPELVRIQRKAFHDIIGVPRTVIEASESFATGLLARAPDDASLRELLRRLASDAWVDRINAYADAGIYRRDLQALGLADRDAVEEAANGSRREILRCIRALVFSASLATSRESGPDALPRLAADLGLPPPVLEARRSVLLPGLVAALLTLAILWAVLPLIPFAALWGGTPSPLWPDGLAASWDYVVALVPVFIAIGLTFQFRPPSTLRDAESAGQGLGYAAGAAFARGAPILIAVFLFDIAFSYLDLLWDLARLPNQLYLTPAYLLREWLFYFVIHAVIAMTASYAVLLWAFVAVNGLRTGGLAVHVVLAILLVGAAATLYAVARVEYQFPDASGISLATSLDYVLLVVVLNVLVAVESLVAATPRYRPRSLRPPVAPPAAAAAA